MSRIAVPDLVRIFHITALGNIPAICEAGALLPKNRVPNYFNIAHQGAQGARSVRQVPNPPGGSVHDFVPFYYALRSPMLYAINGGRVAGCALKQDDVVHFEFTIASVLAGGAQFVIYDRNATLSYAGAYTSLSDLDKIAWDLFFEPPLVGDFSKYFHDRPSVPKHADRLERRMAEFLVQGAVQLNGCTRIGVADSSSQQQVLAMVRHAGMNVAVDVRPDWYF